LAGDIATVTFLFTDLEGSTRLWEAEPDAMRAAVGRHDELLRSAIQANGGSLVSTAGDGLLAAFPTAEAAVCAAVTAQLALAAEPWVVSRPLRARMGIHTDSAPMENGRYLSPPLNRCSRLMAVAHGGQVLCSESTASLAGRMLPAGIDLVDLGVHRLRDLARPMRLFQVCHASLARSFPQLRSMDAYATNLPAQATAFIGRGTEVAQAIEALSVSRLVTLTGVGGVGKTRLALQVAADVLPEYPDGVWLVELGGLTEPGAVEEAVASALGVSQQTGETLVETVLSFLRNKRLVVVLDNCEHLLAGVAAMVESVLATAPGASVLVTSREPLAVAGERILAVPSLPVPGAAGGLASVAAVDAVELFVERARAARSDFSLTAHNVEAVAQLCRRLDGIPLAIELAAARVRSMAPGEVAARLDQRFRLLTGSSRSATSRHQTLRRAIDWSYDLLDEAERALLGRLSVCVGGFDLAAAEAIGSGADVDAFDVDDLLGHLVDKSLVAAEDRGGSTRYRMLDTIRAYALERLENAGEVESARARHAHHYAAFASQAGAGLKSAQERYWQERLEGDLDNLRAAVMWSLDGDDPSPALTIGTSVAFHGVRIEATVGTWASALVASAAAKNDPRYPVALAYGAYGKLREGHNEEASRLGREALVRIDRSPPAAATTCRVLSLTSAVDASQGRNPGGRARQWLATARQSSDAFEEALALCMVAVAELMDGESATATTTADEGLALAFRTGSLSAIAFSSFAAGVTLLDLDPERAAALFEDALRYADAAANDYAYMIALGARSSLLSRAGVHLEAARAFADSARRAFIYGDRPQQATQIWHVAGSLAATGKSEPAAVLMGWAESVLAASEHNAGEGVGPGGVVNFGLLSTAAISALAELPATLGDEGYASLSATGASMSDDEVLRYANEHLSR
jgi:predicted ATPase/class 3 adenylate cyclase